jgi:phosphoglycerate dehydrogenase-like enzyme
MTKIVVIKDLDLTKQQQARLEKLGDLCVHKVPESYDERVDLVKGADVICSGKFGLKQRYQELKNVFISLPFVGVGFFDKEILKKNNITVANSPGCNKTAVSERIIFMILGLFREFNTVLNIKESKEDLPKVTKGLVGRKICILGKWNIWQYTWEVCKKLGMDVSYFARWDNLLEKTKDVEVVVNCLTVNKSTEWLLDDKFFENLSDGCFFVSVVDYITYDVDALIQYLDNGKIAGAALDAMGIQVWDSKDPFYLRIQAHPKILATPHIARASNISIEKWGDMMIDNIEAWLKWEPINVIN